MCFTAYQGLGHFQYRRDVKQIKNGMAWLAKGTRLKQKQVEGHLGLK